MKVEEGIGLLYAVGFRYKGAHGSHYEYEDPETQEKIIVPFHGWGYDLSPKVTGSINKAVEKRKAKLKKGGRKKIRRRKK